MTSPFPEFFMLILGGFFVIWSYFGPGRVQCNISFQRVPKARYERELDGVRKRSAISQNKICIITSEQQATGKAYYNQP